MNIYIITEHGEITANLYPPYCIPPQRLRPNLMGNNLSVQCLPTPFPTLPPTPPQVLRKSPEVLYSLGGEADMEDSAEYGELSTKD